ncbi:MAG: glycosyltransferase family 4 protein [Methanosarcina sp.]
MRYLKILHTVEYYSPSVGGAQEAVKQISEGLVKRGHEVTVATTYLSDRKNHKINDVTIEDFSILGNSVRGFSGDIKSYQKFLLESDFDVMMNYAAQQWTTDLALPILDKISAKKVLVPCGFSGLYDPQYKDYFEKMKTWIAKYDKCIYLSNNYRDINFARSAGVNNEILIPNGAAEEEFTKILDIDIKKKLNIPDNHFLILHVGSHTGVKGHKEAVNIFKKAQITHATLLIIAEDSKSKCSKNCHFSAKKYKWNPFSRLSDKNIIVTPLSRNETIAAYQQADLFLFPSNIECSPIVLFECMASKTPFLTTDVGNTTEIIEWSGAGDILPTIKFKNGYCKAEINSSAKILQNFFDDIDLRQSMGTSGHKAWKSKFTWSIITKKYEGVYEEILENDYL